MADERKPVDVLAVMDDAAKCLRRGVVRVQPAERAEEMDAARAAVAELFEAAKGVSEMEIEPRFLYREIESLRAALARCGVTP